MNLEQRDSNLGLHDDLEHDAFLSGIVRGWDLLARKRWVVLGALAAVVVVVGGGLFLRTQSRLSEERADVLLNRATALLDQMQGEAAKPLLEKVIKEHDGTRASQEAHYFLGMNALASDQVAEARKELTAFLDAHKGEDFLVAAAQGGLAACFEREKKWAEAAEAWSRAAAVDEANNFEAPNYLFNAALCWQLAGKDDQALPLLDRILEDFPKSMLKTKVEALQASLKADA